MKPIKPLYVFLLFWVSFSLKAQQYPVDVQVFVTPPYEQSLRDYWASFEPKIQVYLLLKDLNSPIRNVALRFSLENVQGQPLAQTPDFLQPFQTQLSSGVRKTLSNIELKTLFAFENLQGISENFYNDLLPEGAYFMCFTAYDVATQMPLSAKARTLIQIRRYTPPLPTLPAKGEIISKKNQFQHLVFQWMLRDPAPFTQYEFTLKEVWDNSLGPDEAFISGRLVYQGKIPSNTILYGPDKPILLENKRYVWKVRAFTQNPNNPNQRQSFFHNNGESQAFYFDYVSHCDAPKFLTATTKDNTAHIRWSGSGEPPRASISNADGNGSLYKILYREKGKSWKSQTSNLPQTTLTGLKRGRNYIYKVGVACGLGGQNQSVFSEQTYLYSTEQEFVTPHKANDSTSVQCGVKPEIRIKNREPLQEVLGVNETFTAGDFPVTIIRVTGSNGIFSGEGYVQVPYLLDTKIKVKFDGIKINTERQLFEGKIVTRYDQTERNVVAINEELKNIKNTILKITNINDVQFDKKTKEVVIKKGNVTEKINLSKQKNGSIVVKDEDNKEYEITLTTDQKEIEVYALDRGISPSPNDTINNGKFTEKEIEFQRKLIEELKNDIKEKLNPNHFTNEERRYVEGALKHLDFLRFENCVFTYTNSNKSAGAYTKTLDIKYSEKTPKDDIKITLFHEYLHHVNYMEKVFVYRYNDEMNKRIFNKVEECFEKRKLNINEIYDAFIAYNMNIIGFDVMEWPDFFRDLKDENKKNMVYDYKKRNIEQFNTEVCIQDQYMPSNYYADEISVYSICMKLNNELFSFSTNKLEQYKIDLETYRIRHKKAVKYEKDNNFDNQGYPTKK